MAVKVLELYLTFHGKYIQGDYEVVDSYCACSFPKDSWGQGYVVCFDFIKNTVLGYLLHFYIYTASQ